MEKSKYFTPEIEDIFVGYECESTNNGKDWYEWKFEYYNFVALDIELLNNMYRTSYLTKEQIIKEGWENITLPKSYGEHFVKEDCRIQWMPNKKAIYFAQGLDIIYKGFCPSINEFRKIE